MNLINAFGLNQFLQRRLNITDSPAPANSLAPEIMPVIQATPPSQEDDYLRGVRRCGASTLLPAAGPGNPNVIALQNPAGSGSLLMLDKVLIGLGQNALYTYHYLETTAFMPGIASLGTAVLDSRWRATGTTRTVGIFRGGAHAGGAPHISWVYWATVRFDNFVKIYLEPKAVIHPGYAYIIYTDNDSVLNVIMQWRERPAEPSELV